ncbi:MAG: RtcB family protein [Magnetococcales bacterium]|nr:RtcB family protein [Magnetococcales bacterium]
MELAGGKKPVKVYTQQIDPTSCRQLEQVASLPFIFHHVAAMPDVHAGIGATVGAVIPTKGALIPAAVGVDIGCGMLAVPLDLPLQQVSQQAATLRQALEKAIPHGRTDNGGPNDRGAWGNPPPKVQQWYEQNGLEANHAPILKRHPTMISRHTNSVRHLGTLGTGNHFIELCGDEQDRLWVLLHSGSRGIGNRIGSYFIELACKQAKEDKIPLPNPDLGYFKENSQEFHDYLDCVQWAQSFAKANRQFMLNLLLDTLQKTLDQAINPTDTVIDCHHNYTEQEEHFGSKIWVTRKGAIRARSGERGIIPGSMGAKSFIVRGLGNPVSFQSSSHGAGRIMSRGDALRRFKETDLIRQTQGIECRKDKRVLDEIPAAYKNIDEVMANQSDLTQVEHTLRQVLCIKG